jgi:hypothetical protein
MSFHLLSIDVGIRNLAFCLFSRDSAQEHLRIKKWDVVDLTTEETLKCSLCNQNAKFQKNGVCYCAKHAKKTSWQVPKPEHKPRALAKHKVAKLQEMMESLGLVLEFTGKKKPTKATMVQAIQEHLSEHFLDFVNTTNASTINLVKVGRNLKAQFEPVFRDVTHLNVVAIENQIGPDAVRMKTLQGMLAQYFIMSHMQVDDIRDISSANKLKACEKEHKNTYKNRKQLSVARCLERMNEPTSPFHEHLAMFRSHEKRDDLADCFMQGVWVLDGIPTILEDEQINSCS